MVDKKSTSDDQENIASHMHDNIMITWTGQPPAELLTQAGEWLEKYGDENAASTYYEAALLVSPEYGLSAWRSGQLELKKHNFPNAVGKFKQMLRISPDHAPTHYLISLAYSAMGQAEDALAYANSTLLYNSKHDGAYLQKLRCLSQLEKWNELNSICLNLPPSLNRVGEVHLWCSLAAFHINDFQMGRFHYEQISPKLKRQFPDVVKQIEELIK